MSDGHRLQKQAVVQEKLATRKSISSMMQAKGMQLAPGLQECEHLRAELQVALSVI